MNTIINSAMKKILILFILLILVGCDSSSSYLKLGYSDKATSIIDTLSNDKKQLFYEYNPKYDELLNNEKFDKKNLINYLNLLDRYSVEDTIFFVNEKYTDEEIAKHNEIIKDPYYIEKNYTLYFNNFDKYENARSLVEAVNSKAIFEQYYNVYKSNFNDKYLILVNKFNFLGSDFIPDNLVDVDLKYTRYKIQLENKCYEAYKKMYDDAFELGYDLAIVSGYRSYMTQVWTYNNFLTQDPREVVDTYSARPGYSEHQTGLAIDIVSPGYNFDTFADSDEAKWLKDNCYKYGFIIRYPKEKTNITLYKYESWHVRYLGDIAKDVYDSGLTYDEYYEYYIR